MKASDLFKQYVWLTDTIYRAGEISFQEINGLWVKTVMSNGIPMGRTTFNRCRTAIEEIFNLNIECKKKDVYVYYIDNKDILKNNSIQHWMLDSLSVSNMLLDSISMKEYILLENIPSGRKHLHTIINGMKLKCKLALEYKKFGREKAHNITVAPYAVKVFKQRWYLLANDGKWDVPAVYALDRIISLQMTHQPYEYPKGFDAENFFKDCYGVVCGTKDVAKKIIIRAYPPYINYLRTLPLHASQKELENTAEYTDFEYFLHPTFDFKQELLSQGDEVEVLEPIEFREEMKGMLQRMLDRYN